MFRRFGDLCIWAAAVDRERLAGFPQDRARYVTIGGAVFTVASMALLSAIAFARVVLHFGVPGALAFGLWWGVVILNIERLIQAAIHRESSWQRTLLLALPRIALAVIFGLVIALPLELKAFAPEIHAQARLDKNDADYRAHLALDEQFAEITDLEKQANTLQAAITTVSTGDILFTNTAYQDIAKRYGQLNAQAQAAPTEALRRHYERRADLARNRLVPLRAELLAQEREANRADKQAKQTELDAVIARLDRLVNAKQDKDDALREAFQAEDGLSDQVHALHEITDAKPAVSSVSLLLWLVVFSIDIVAAVMRALMSLGEPCDFEQSELARSKTNRDITEEIEAIFRTQELELGHERARMHAEVEREQMRREFDLQKRMDAEFADAVEDGILSHARRWGRRHAEDYIRETDDAA